MHFLIDFQNLFYVTILFDPKNCLLKKRVYLYRGNYIDFIDGVG